MKKISKKSWLAIVIFSLFGQIAWTMENMFFNSFIKHKFNADGNQIALMVSLSAIVATLTTLFMGALSDKFGKRKIFICSGYILWGISILSFSLLKLDILSSLFPYANAMSLGVALVILFDCIMTFFGSTANDANFNSWITDITDNSNRGKVEGVISAMPLLAVLVVFGGFASFMDNDQWDVIFITIGVAVLLIGILGIFIIKESNVKPNKDESYFKNIFHGFRPSVIKSNKLLYLIFIAFVVFGISNQVFMPYYVLYLTDGLKMKDYVFIMAPAILLAAIVTFLFGRYLDRKKFRKAIKPVFLIYIVGLIILYSVTEPFLVFLGCFLTMAGFLSCNAAFGAIIRDYTPKANVGLFQGIRMFVMVLIPMLIGPWLGSALSGDSSTLVGGVTSEGFVPTSMIFLGAAIVGILTIIPLHFVYKNIKTVYVDLTTPYEEDLDETCPYKDYPRPQFKRDSYINLNGIWKYTITEDESLPNEFNDDILVPFPLESRLSKVHKKIKDNEILYYKKEFSLPKDFIQDEVILHIDAASQFADVYINGTLVAESKNGYLPIIVNIKKYLKDVNTLIVKVKNSIDITYPYGKQSHNPGGMWYTPTTGIWQTVWLESVSDDHIKNITLNPLFDDEALKLDIESDAKEFEITILDQENIIYSIKTCDKNLVIPIKDMKAWSPASPNLYDLIIKTKGDEVKSYFAMRKIHIEGNKIYLNNKSYFFNGLLDQGYYPDGIFLPATKQGFIDDIVRMKELGFNTLRKHIKIEPMEFYYQCDKIGMIVFQDMVSNGEYDFLRDTLWPTLGFQKRIDTKQSKDSPFYLNFKDSCIKTVKYLYNVPSILQWTIFNEGWGQCHSDEFYDLFKKLDPTRIIDSTSGWFAQSKNDVVSKHIYFKPIIYIKKNKPVIISEFGGYSYKLENNSYNLTNTYGYKNFYSQESFEKGIIKIYKNRILPHINDGLCGTIITQVSDVEDETNGFVTYDRRIVKVRKEIMQDLFKDLQK